MNKNDNATAIDDWSNYWQGRNSGEAFQGEGVETDARLADYWRAIFATVLPEAKLLDLGCGAGSVLNRAHEAGLRHLTGLDFSPAAIAVLAEKLPDVTGIVGDFTAPPLGDQRFDIITSQFGIEYAGVEAFSRIAPFLDQGGSLCMLCHIKGGVIDKEVQGHLVNIQKIHDTDYISSAHNYISSLFGQGANQQAKKPFEDARDKLVALIESGVKGLTIHLNNGFEQLHQRHQAYALEDITGWLDGMSKELSNYTGRMQAMQAAALDGAEIDKVCAQLEGAGLVNVKATAFALSEDDGPIAWALNGSRP